MIKRKCPECGEVLYSADTTPQPWTCPLCGGIVSETDINGVRWMVKIINYMGTHKPPWWLPLCFGVPAIIVSVIAILMKLQLI